LCVFVLLWHEFSPILTLFFKHSRKFGGVRKFPSENPSYALVYAITKSKSKSKNLKVFPPQHKKSYMFVDWLWYIFDSAEDRKKLLVWYMGLEVKWLILCAVDRKLVKFFNIMRFSLDLEEKGFSLTESFQSYNEIFWKNKKIDKVIW
jgi:RimJ/RimL family protein N-acetyltransferase